MTDKPTAPRELVLRRKRLSNVGFAVFFVYTRGTSRHAKTWLAQTRTLGRAFAEGEAHRGSKVPILLSNAIFQETFVGEVHQLRIVHME